MVISGRSTACTGSETRGRSSDRNLLNDSGDISRVLLDPDEARLARSSDGVYDRGASSSASASELCRDKELVFREKSFRGDQDQLGVGERDRADRLCLRLMGDVARRTPGISGIFGAGLGVTNLSPGFNVL